jgi:hypothetical protein
MIQLSLIGSDHVGYGTLESLHDTLLANGFQYRYATIAPKAWLRGSDRPQSLVVGFAPDDPGSYEGALTAYRLGRRDVLFFLRKDGMGYIVNDNPFGLMRGLAVLAPDSLVQVLPEIESQVSTTEPDSILRWAGTIVEATATDTWANVALGGLAQPCRAFAVAQRIAGTPTPDTILVYSPLPALFRARCILALDQVTEKVFAARGFSSGILSVDGDKVGDRRLSRIDFYARVRALRGER